MSWLVRLGFLPHPNAARENVLALRRVERQRAEMQALGRRLEVIRQHRGEFDADEEPDSNEHPDAADGEYRGER